MIHLLNGFPAVMLGNVMEVVWRGGGAPPKLLFISGEFVAIGRSVPLLVDTGAQACLGDYSIPDH